MRLIIRHHSEIRGFHKIQICPEVCWLPDVKRADAVSWERWWDASVAALPKCDAWAILGAVDTVVLAGKSLERPFPHTRAPLCRWKRHNRARVPAYLLGSKQRHKCWDEGSSHGCSRSESGDRLDPTTKVGGSGLPALTSCEILGRCYHLSEFWCR